MKNSQAVRTGDLRTESCCFENCVGTPNKACHLILSTVVFLIAMYNTLAHFVTPSFTLSDNPDITTIHSHTAHVSMGRGTSKTYWVKDRPL